MDNSTYTGPGVNGNPNSCPFACNPGYILSSAGQCVLTGHCADCPAGTYSWQGLTSCNRCNAGKFTSEVGSTACSNDCMLCPAGLFTANCGASQGVCANCTNPT